MASKVTMQDIADAMGLSRNTVSKAINNTGVISDYTKELVLRKAAEMGYKNLYSNSVMDTAAAHPASASDARREIAMLTCSIPGGSHFAVTALDRMQQIFTLHGYDLAFYRVTARELEELQLPGNFRKKDTVAIFCMELFHYDYCKMLSELGLPLLLIDGPIPKNADPLPVDLLVNENHEGIFSFVKEISARGKRSVGFVGNMMHCRSFFERGSACITAAVINGMPHAEQYSILSFPPGPDSTRSATYADYSDDLYDRLRELPALPDAFICANDFIAINLISSLRRMDLRCPEDILVMGFDDSPESRFHSPSLTTVHIHTQAMGNLAAELILDRIADPDRQTRTTYSPTDLIMRESSRITT